MDYDRSQVVPGVMLSLRDSVLLNSTFLWPLKAGLN